MGGGKGQHSATLTSELLFMGTKTKIQHLTGVCRDELSLTHSCKQSFCLQLTVIHIGVQTCIHTLAHNGSVGKQLLHTFIGNYCRRSHIGGGAEFQEKKKSLVLM